MKIVFLLLAFLVTDNRCCNPSKSINQEVLSFEYSAVSRGFFQNITIDKNKIKITSAKGEKAIEKSCSKNLWTTLLSSIDSLEINTIKNLEAPSNKRFYDGAAHATLSINYDGKTYKTRSFDHGNPPIPILPLVTAIQSVSENIE